LVSKERVSKLNLQLRERLAGAIPLKFSPFCAAPTLLLPTVITAAADSWTLVLYLLRVVYEYEVGNLFHFSWVALDKDLSVKKLTVEDLG
jgi:hypothetical protein